MSSIFTSNLKGREMDISLLGIHKQIKKKENEMTELNSTIGYSQERAPRLKRILCIWKFKV